MASVCWWSNLPSFEINVNAPIDININAPIDFAKSSIWLAVPVSLRIGALQRDVHAVTQSYLLMHKRDQLSSVFFGHFQQFFKSLSIDRQLKCIPDSLPDYCGKIICLGKSGFKDRLSHIDCIFKNCSVSGLAHSYFLLQHARIFLHLRTWSRIRLHTSCFGWGRDTAYVNMNFFMWSFKAWIKVVGVHQVSRQVFWE